MPEDAPQSPLVERAYVLLPLADKNRPAIVLALLDDGLARVIYGTGTARDMLRIEVRPESRNGKALGLYKPTYFYASNVRIADAALLVQTGKRCPPELFLMLRALVTQGLAPG